MSVELLYTSAEQGLKQGSRGFCTVISTAGMPINLANRLESLSGYRHVYPPNSEEAGQNPVAHSHLRLSVGGRVVSVISRVADYGLDYSQRTNKIAHHVVLDSGELPQAGPAWLMEQSEVFRTEWDGHCKTPSSGPVIPLGDRCPIVCRRWYSVVGDAGWAGVLADNLSRPNAKPVWIVFSIDQSAHLLPMLNEAISLIPVPQRWLVTFSTYATTIPPDIDCRVRCVLEGSNEARLAPARGPVIDLTKPLSLAPSAPLVILAREGPKLESAVVRPAIFPAALCDAGELGENVDLGSKSIAFQLASGKATSATKQAGVEDLMIGRDDEFEVLPHTPRSTKPPPPLMRAHGKSSILAPRQQAILVLALVFVLSVGIAIFSWKTLEKSDQVDQDLVVESSKDLQLSRPTSVIEAETAGVSDDKASDSSTSEPNFTASGNLSVLSSRPNDSNAGTTQSQGNAARNVGRENPSQVLEHALDTSSAETSMAGIPHKQDQVDSSGQAVVQPEKNAMPETQLFTDGIFVCSKCFSNPSMGEATFLGHVKLNMEGELYFREVWKQDSMYANFSTERPIPNSKSVDGWVTKHIYRSTKQSTVLEVKIVFSLHNDAKLAELKTHVQSWNFEFPIFEIVKLQPRTPVPVIEILTSTTKFSETCQKEIDEMIKSREGSQDANDSRELEALRARKMRIDKIKELAKSIVDEFANAMKSSQSPEIELSTGIELATYKEKNGWQPQPLILRLDLTKLTSSYQGDTPGFIAPNGPSQVTPIPQRAPEGNL